MSNERVVSIGPRGLPALRNLKIRQMRERVNFHARNTQGDWRAFSGSLEYEEDLSVNYAMEGLQTSTLYYGTSDLSTLVHGAWIAKPYDDSKVDTRSLIDVNSGFIYIASDDGTPSPCLLWRFTPSGEGYWYWHRAVNEMIPLRAFAYWDERVPYYGEGSRKGEFLPRTQGNSLALRMGRLVLSLLAQPNLAQKTPSEPRPDQIKRARKNRHPAPETVMVIDLRREVAERQARVEAARSSPRHSRWIVSGHWRQQPCGPKLSQRRRIYIEPHYKGPVDAPLVLKEKVFKW